MRGVAILCLLGVLLSGCPRTAEPHPTQTEALAFLDRVIEVAQDGDFAGLCALGAGNCERILDQSGRDVPDDRPTVVGSRESPSSNNAIGGVVLELCGTLNSGERYYTEMLVFRDSVRDGGLNGLHAIEPIYWSGYGVASDNQVGGEGSDAEELCA